MILNFLITIKILSLKLKFKIYYTKYNLVNAAPILKSISLLASTESFKKGFGSLKF